MSGELIPVKTDTYPRYAIFGNIGKVRVLEYIGDGKFWVLDKHDDKRIAHRNQLQFLKDKK